VEIAPFPEGMTTNLARRKGETDAELAQRRATYAATVLEQRVSITRRS